MIKPTIEGILKKASHINPHSSFFSSLNPFIIVRTDKQSDNASNEIKISKTGLGSISVLTPNNRIRIMIK
jgi:hypothetical protein